MRILVTGADGMLGSNLVRVLLDRGHEVSAFLHPSSRSKTLEGLNFSTFFGDILHPETLHPAFKDMEAVIHAAASTSIWPSRSEAVRRINIEGTRNVIDAALIHQVKRMIYIGSGSSVNAPGRPSGKYPFPGAKYGLDYIDSKYEALNLVLDAVKTRGLPALAILPTYMIGAYDSLPGSGRMIQALAQGRLKVFTGGGRNFIHVRDVAVAIANSLEMGRIGQYYIAGNENLTYREFFAKTARIVDMPEPRIRIPGWLVKTFGLLGSLSGEILKKQPLLSYPMARVSCDKQYVSSETALQELGMPQTAIETAIRECYNWFVENGYLTKK
jgi:dihydroflavonol-4-reductase